jgi:hypothetical protein
LKRLFQLQQIVGYDNAASLLALVKEEPGLDGFPIDDMKRVDDILEA